MRLTGSPLLVSIISVASGTAAAQVVVFAFSPLITRIYSPEIFGLQGIFLSLLGILSPIITLRYPMAIITAKTEADALRLARLSLVIAVGMSVLLFLLLLLGGDTILNMLGAEGLGVLALLLPLALLCVALEEITDFRAARLGVFRLMGIAAVLQAFIANLARVLGGLAIPASGMLITVTAFSPAVKVAMLYIGARDLRRSAPRLLRIEATTLLRRHRDFPIYRMPTDVLNALSQAIPVLLLASLFSPIAAGLYVLTRSVMNLPSNIIGTAVGNVLYARFAELDREGQSLMPLLLRSTSALLALAPAIIGLAWFAPTVFAFVFGEEWREAGYYAQWMSLWLGVALANVPAVRMAPVIKAQSILLFVNILMLLARLAAMIWASSMQWSAVSAVAVFSIVSLIANTALIITIAQRCLRHDRLSRGTH